LFGGGFANLGDFWVVKLDSQANKMWDRSYGGSDDDVLFSVQSVGDTGYILGGYSRSDSDGNKTSPNYGSQDFWVVKVVGDGNKLWEKTFGATDFDELLALNATEDGGFILGGSSSSPVSGNKTNANLGDKDLWVLKLGPDAFTAPPRLTTLPQTQEEIVNSGFHLQTSEKRG
jgi:hypothetical protein